MKPNMFKDTIGVLPARYQKFEYKLITTWMRVGLWRGDLPEAKHMNIGRVFLASLCPLYVLLAVGSILYLKECLDMPMDVLVGPYTDAFLFCACVVGFVIMQTKKTEDFICRYYNELHLSNYNHENRTTKKILLQVEEYCLKLGTITEWMVVLATSSFIAMPIAFNTRSGAFTNSTTALETCLHVAAPFDYQHNVTNWLFATILFSIVSYIMCFFAMYSDNIVIYYALHLWGNTEILKSNLEDITEFVKLKKYNLNEKDNNYITQELKKIIDHHCSLYKSIDAIDGCVSPFVFFCYIYFASATCVLMLALMKDFLNAIRYAGVMFAVMLKLSAQTYAYEVIAKSVESIQDAIYTVPWYAMNKQNKRNVYIMLLVAQRPIILKALGLIRINVDTMVKMIKSSLSYFFWLYSNLW